MTQTLINHLNDDIDECNDKINDIKNRCSDILLPIRYFEKMNIKLNYLPVGLLFDEIICKYFDNNWVKKKYCVNRGVDMREPLKEITAKSIKYINDNSDLPEIIKKNITFNFDSETIKGWLKNDDYYLQMIDYDMSPYYKYMFEREYYKLIDRYEDKKESDTKLIYNINNRLDIDDIVNLSQKSIVIWGERESYFRYRLIKFCPKTVKYAQMWNGRHRIYKNIEFFRNMSEWKFGIETCFGGHMTIDKNNIDEYL